MVSVWWSVEVEEKVGVWGMKGDMAEDILQDILEPAQHFQAVLSILNLDSLGSNEGAALVDLWIPI